MRLTAVMDGGIFMSKFNTKALCRIAMLAALYVLLMLLVRQEDFRDLMRRYKT